MFRRPFIIASLSLAYAGSGQLFAQADQFELPERFEYMLEDHCWKCHDDSSQKGDIRLDNLAAIGLDERLDLLNRMHEQTYLEHMPPADEDTQPSQEDRQALIDWISKNLKKHNAETLPSKLRRAEYANYVDHDKLFSGEYAHLKPFSPDRHWLISEYIFNQKFNRLLRLGTNQRKGPNLIGLNIAGNLANPFILPNSSGVRYYDTTTLDSGHFLTMKANADKVSARIMKIARDKGGSDFGTIYHLMKQQWKDGDTLARREKYLLLHIEKLLIDVFGSQRHEAMLPPFELAHVDFTPEKNPPSFKGSQPSRDDYPAVKNAIILLGLEDRNQFDAQMFRLCDRVWSNYGYPEAKRIRWGKFMKNNYPKWRKSYYRKIRLPEPGKLAEGELVLIQKTLKENRSQGDTYLDIIEKCKDQWSRELRELREQDAKSGRKAAIQALITELHEEILERKPDDEEAKKYFNLVENYIDKLGTNSAIRKYIETLILSSEFVYRREYGAGAVDAHGRRMLPPRDAAYAIAYALTDDSPDDQLMAAAKSGKLNTRADYEREVKRLLAQRNKLYLVDRSVNELEKQSFTDLPIRKLRFFREFFGYPNMLSIFKDDVRFGGPYQPVSAGLVSEADLLVEHILKEDRNVIEELLSTDRFYVYHSGDNEEMADYTKNLRKIYDEFRDKDWENFTQKDILKHSKFFRENGVNLGSRQTENRFQVTMRSIMARFDKGQKWAPPYAAVGPVGPGAQDRAGFRMDHELVTRAYNIDLNDWNYPVEQPAQVSNRAGILTHPAWLIAFARNTESDPIHRGKWIREKLLAGTIPDVPITVDASIPEDHTKTLRTRVDEKTGDTYCWKCHVYMNPLGNAFEMYDDFGRYRTEEFLEHPDNLIEKGDGVNAHNFNVFTDWRATYKTLPVKTDGHLKGTGDPTLDGDVKNALDLTKRLAKSDRVRQSVIRHAFRYFMGRNETLSDSKTLIDADQAYLKSNGSFDAVIVSLLTSDSFIYRKPTTIN